MFCNEAVAADLAQVSSPSAGAIHMSDLHRSGSDARGAGGPMNRVLARTGTTSATSAAITRGTRCAIHPPASGTDSSPEAS